MRKIINSTYISLDGVIEDPHLWTMDYFDEDAQRYAHDLLFSCDALIAGRETYVAFAETWPHMEEQTGDFGVRMNTIPKYAVSTTLEKGEWNNTTIIKDNVAEEVRRLKEQPGQNILQYGFGSVSRLLVENGLLDELRLWIHPVIVGTGNTADLLTTDGFGATFELADTTTFGSGVIVATYRPAPKKEDA
ncbi:dihydrofolate reductase family protein [Actinomadura rugatobispora]|uniref:Dihydrofolate reductase family protein n=1 Tax=Actinomadura rugatobispora TaxID=1994 RepID=A0ABW1ABJ9_9ACTN|nr:dihydrofolate reductase family protein [Actinomadura rugatobispora]